MPEEPVITMNEFKMVVENFDAKLKVIAEGITSIRTEMKDEFQAVKQDIYSLKEQVGGLTVDVHSLKDDVHNLKNDVHELKDDVHGLKDDVNNLKDQVALFHEGQTEIKNELMQKVSRDEFGRLELRVAKLENKAA